MTDTLTPELADVPECFVLAIDGRGAPAGPGFDAAVRALQPHAPIEGTWWLVHHGPYEDEGPALAALYAFVAEQGLTPAGPHTETYVTDPTAAEPSELVTRVAVALAPAGEDAPA